THFGTDEHTVTGQELPAVYVNPEFSRFVYYGGNIPWTNASISTATMAALPKSSVFYVPERWGAFVNDRDIGLTLFAPDHWPYASGFTNHASGRVDPKYPHAGWTDYFMIRASYAFGPKSVLEGDYYLFAGDF